MSWPDLIAFRRNAFPGLDRVFQDRIKFSFEKYENEFAGVEKRAPAEVRRDLHSMDNVFVNNLAALKYVETEDGRVYEVGSYAYRPDGRFGYWQTHIMLFPHKDGTAVLAHREPSPLANADGGWLSALLAGIKHYWAPPEKHQPAAGIEQANQLLDLQSDASFDDISN